MFEKEAEEIMNNHCDCEMLSECLAGIRTRCSDFEESKKLLIEGAEFGYNKAKEEMQEQGLALQSDMDKTIEQNIQLKNQNNWLEGCKLELAEHLGKANDKNAELKAQIEKMKCCGNCSFSYCKTSSEHIDKDGNIIFHCWNIEKRTYCDVGKNGKYQCWQLRN